MEWFEGEISAGIAEAKKRNTLFVVYIRDDSDDSKKMDQTWESPEVATVCKKLGLVAMRFVKDSSECKMFSQCYPVLIVPSVSFISGETGVLLEATAGQVDAPGFIERINAAAKIPKGQGSSTTDKTSKPERSQTTPAQTETTSPVAPTPEVPVTTPTEEKESVQERAARLRKKMEEVHAKKEAQKKETVKQKELERRKVGQSMQKVQQQRAEDELKQNAVEKRREKMEDKIARQRVREQIARDRAEKDATFAAARDEEQKRKTATQEANVEKQRADDIARAAANRETARLQFRLPDGSKILHQFPSSATLGEARQYVAEQVGSVLQDFSMSTAFPRRQFGTSDMDTSLLDLQLAPSAAVIILPGSERSSTSTAVASGGGFIALLLAPIIYLWNFLYTFIFGTPTENPASGDVTSSSPQEPPQADHYNTMGARPKSSYARRRNPPQPEGGSIARQEGNIHRLNRDDDNDDENNTWNGNSTQQM